MKKLAFFAAAAAMCGGLLAVESANVVGYQELGTDATGKKMVVPTFLNVGESNKVSLADLKVTGYTAPSKNAKGKWVNGCRANQFILSKLTTAGTEEVSYHWLETGEIGPGWFASSSGDAIDGGASSVKFDAGMGFWTFGSDYKLVPAGAVNTFDVEFTTDAMGKVAVGNSMPTNIKLSDLVVTGYTAPSKNAKGKWVNGCRANQFILSKLTTAGTEEVSYHWLETGEIGPGWFASSSGDAIEGGANNVTIPAGQGLWTFGSGYKLVIPAPEL